jgi:hypothetical protein
MTSDYDVDGFVDLFVTNGVHLYPLLKGYEAGGPDKLFRNLGNANHWLEFDLRGTMSNRDGLGATIEVTAGGKSQLREQNGGYHRWAQHDRRLHFGLAQNTLARVTVRWPSGRIDSYSNVHADRLYEITEGNPALVPIDVPTSTPPSECNLTIGKPAYSVSDDRALFLWRDSCASQRWNVRVTGGAGPNITYTGRIESNLPLTAVTPSGLETNDLLVPENSATHLRYSWVVRSARQDGFAFTADPVARTCFGVDANTGSAFVGPGRTRISLPFDLRTLEPCG